MPEAQPATETTPPQPPVPMPGRDMRADLQKQQMEAGNGTIVPAGHPDTTPTANPVQEAHGLIDASAKRGDISEAEALVMKAQVRVDAAKSESKTGTIVPVENASYGKDLIKDRKQCQR
jgi:hypothetical protein